MIFEQHKVFVGVDLGQLQDFSAVCVLCVDVLERPTGPETGNRRFDSIERVPILNIIHLAKWQSTYRESLQKIAQILQHPSLILDDVDLILDQSGVGQAVFEMADNLGLNPSGIVITSGQHSRVDESGTLLVPRVQLLSATVVAYENGQVRIPEELPLRSELEAELMNLQLQVRRKSGAETIDQATTATHDDLAIAVSLAIWSALNEFSTETVYADRLHDEAGPRDRAAIWDPISDPRWSVDEL